jgi:hypothetical protein
VRCVQIVSSTRTQQCAHEAAGVCPQPHRRTKERCSQHRPGSTPLECPIAIIMQRCKRSLAMYRVCIGQALARLRAAMLMQPICKKIVPFILHYPAARSPSNAQWLCKGKKPCVGNAPGALASLLPWLPCCPTGAPISAGFILPGPFAVCWRCTTGVQVACERRVSGI